MVWKRRYKEAKINPIPLDDEDDMDDEVIDSPSQDISEDYDEPSSQPPTSPRSEEKEEEDLFGEEDLGDDFYDGGGVSPLQRHNDLLKDLTNFAPYLKETVNGWLGVTWNEESNGYLKNPELKPIMNIRGAAWCISYLKTYARPNNIITDINKEDYKFIICDIVDAVWLNVGCRAEEFDIQEEGDILRVCVEVEHAASLILMGAGDGRYNKFLGTVTTRHETVQNNPMMQGAMIQGQMGKLSTVDKLRKAIFGG